MKIRYAAAALLLGLTACTAPSQPFLDQARTDCQTGNQTACRQIPGLQAQVNYEHQQQSEKVAAGILLGITAAAVGAAAGYSASHPTYDTIYVVPCHGWGCW